MNIVLSKPGYKGNLSFTVSSLVGFTEMEIDGMAISIAIEIDMCNSTFNFKEAKLQEDLTLDGTYEERLRKKEIFVSALRRELSVIGIELISDN